MNNISIFPNEEYAARLQNFKRLIAERGLEASLITVPENIYYLTGLDHQGYFAVHLLVVPQEGQMQLVARGMERVTMEAQIPEVIFRGYGDGEDPAVFTCRVLREIGLASARLGMEKRSGFLSYHVAEGLVDGLPEAHWRDISGLVDELRLVKSPRELAYVRQAARVTDAMMGAAMQTAGEGVNEREIAAEVYRAMVLAGGEYPGFHPFIRTTDRLGEEHTTWQDNVLDDGDVLFVELAGCVRRYHAPMGRLIFVGKVPPGTQEMAQICLEAFDSVVRAIQPGVRAADVYQAWQDRVDRAGLAHYRRHHCGYLVGIGFPPSWTGGNTVVGLRHDSQRILQPGMVFHLLSWLMGTGHPGDYFVSNTAVLTEEGCQVLTTAPREVQVV
jgi:Xaa-Pro dipeptidase